MTSFVQRLLPILAVTLALAGCVAYPAGYYAPGYAYAPAAPCCAYVAVGGGWGWHGGGWHGGWHHW